MSKLAVTDESGVRIPRLYRYAVALQCVAMATETTTIRVTRETRDLLAEQARERGVSLASMLAELARQVERETVFRAEREAARADDRDPDVRAEEREWETTLGDGID
jgi:hypothetical protein